MNRPTLMRGARRRRTQRWHVQRAASGHGWIAYRADLTGAMLFRTQRFAMQYAMKDGAL